MTTIDHQPFIQASAQTLTDLCAEDETDSHIEPQLEACEHDELDHGICLHCGHDCMDDIVASAEFAADCREDR